MIVAIRDHDHISTSTITDPAVCRSILDDARRAVETFGHLMYNDSESFRGFCPDHISDWSTYRPCFEGTVSEREV